MTNPDPRVPSPEPRVPSPDAWPDGTQVWLGRIGQYWNAQVILPGGAKCSGHAPTIAEALEMAGKEWSVASGQ